MDVKESAAKKTTGVAKKTSAIVDKDESKSATQAVTTSSVRKLVSAKRKPAAGFVRVIMNPVVKPKHFSVTAIRNAVRLVASSK